MNGISASFSSIISESGTKTLGHPLQKLNKNDYFGNLIYLSGKSHILENAASLARGWIDFPSGNTTSLYLLKIVSVLNCSDDSPVKCFHDSLYISVGAYAND